MIKKLSIYGFRGFSVEQTVEFATPNNDKGSGLTVITGANNSGKTTIIEAIRTFNEPMDSKEGPSFSEGKRNISCKNVIISITDEFDNNYAISTSGGSTSIRSGPNNNLNYYIVQSRRAFQFEFGKSRADKQYYLNYGLRFGTRKSSLDSFEYRIFEINRSKESFNHIFWKILGYELEWALDQHDNGQYYIKCNGGTGIHSTEGLGDGIWSVFVISAALYDSKDNDVIVIDEPELSLHPATQKRLMSVLLEYSSTRQIILSTHSPYFIDLNSIANGGRIIRVVKENHSTKCYITDDVFKNNCTKVTKDLNNPHVLGINAKEAFFLEDNIIIVEGQEDVVIYQKIADHLNIQIKGDFFGWGAGGAEKIKLFLSMFRILGFKHIVALFDNDKINILNEIQPEFSEYLIMSIPCDDIRDKKRGGTIIKEGVTYENGELKNEYRDKMKYILKTINSYFEGCSLHPVSGDPAYCRALSSEVRLTERLCSGCPLCAGGVGECAYAEDGDSFPAFIDSVRWSGHHEIFQKAVKYAAEAYCGMVRKDTDLPYISHPMEAAMIASTITDDPEIVAAAALHDIVENTPHTISDIKSAFGDRIASIVGHEGEDKRPDLPPSESWKVRKEKFLDGLRSAPHEARVVALADKLSNMRSMAEGFRTLGDALWDRFNQMNPAMQEWYYRTVADILSDLSGTDAWREYSKLCDEVFGRRTQEDLQSRPGPPCEPFSTLNAPDEICPKARWPSGRGSVTGRSRPRRTPG